MRVGEKMIRCVDCKREILGLATEATTTVCGECQVRKVFPKTCRECGEPLPLDRVRYHLACIEAIVEREGQ